MSAPIDITRNCVFCHSSTENIHCRTCKKVWCDREDCDINNDCNDCKNIVILSTSYGDKRTFLASNIIKNRNPQQKQTSIEQQNQQQINKVDSTAFKIKSLAFCLNILTLSFLIFVIATVYLFSEHAININKQNITLNNLITKKKGYFN